MWYSFYQNYGRYHFLVKNEYLGINGIQVVQSFNSSTLLWFVFCQKSPEWGRRYAWELSPWQCSSVVSTTAAPFSTGSVRAGERGNLSLPGWPGLSSRWCWPVASLETHKHFLHRSCVVPDYTGVPRPGKILFMRGCVGDSSYTPMKGFLGHSCRKDLFHSKTTRKN